MTTQVSFYSLHQSDPRARLHFACRLTEKARNLGHRVFILVDGPDQGRDMDALLWSYKPDAFVPHTLNETEQPEREMVAIGSARQLELHSDLLINLAKEPVHDTARFTRINEIVCKDPEITRNGRERYRHYQGQGHDIETFRI